MSDDSELDDEQPQYDIYQKKYQLLLERCDVLQQDNERLVNRLVFIKNLFFPLFFKSFFSIF